jgi:hypothetical protein
LREAVGWVLKEALGFERGSGEIAVDWEHLSSTVSHQQSNRTDTYIHTNTYTHNHTTTQPHTHKHKHTHTALKTGELLPSATSVC